MKTKKTRGMIPFQNEETGFGSDPKCLALSFGSGFFIFRLVPFRSYMNALI